MKLLGTKYQVPIKLTTNQKGGEGEMGHDKRREKAVKVLGERKRKKKRGRKGNENVLYTSNARKGTTVM